jgi:hypothetical protein
MAQSKSCFSSRDIPFVLFEVKNLRHHVGTGYSMDWLEVRFKEKMTLAATQYHVFVTIRNGEKIFVPTFGLRVGDKIWVDTSAFGADKSLYKTRLH